MIAGTSVQLTPTLANLGGGVTWSATGGAITPGGLFTAPGHAGIGHGHGDQHGRIRT